MLISEILHENWLPAKPILKDDYGPSHLIMIWRGMVEHMIVTVYADAKIAAEEAPTWHLYVKIEDQNMQRMDSLYGNRAFLENLRQAMAEAFIPSARNITYADEDLQGRSYITLSVATHKFAQWMVKQHDALVKSGLKTYT